MRILALNCGSSSIKSAVFDAARLRRLQTIRVENIGSAGGCMLVDEERHPLNGIADLATALKRLLDKWRKQPALEGLAAVVHRVVHGGDRFLGPVRLDDDALKQLDALSSLAPLHNPPALDAIRAAQAVYPDIPHIAVFDTAFHATLPRYAREYALPAQVRTSSGIRRYGFHGLSHAQVAIRVASHLKRAPQELRIVSCHLGNGASITAIEAGRSVETSMGMTPLEGLVMGTRGGDIDPGVLLHLLTAGGMSVGALDDVLNHGSGLKGLTGTHDMREIERRAAEGDDECRLALLVYAHRVRKYIGAYAAVMGGVDAIAFTGGVGENSAQIRDLCVQRMDFLGVKLDAERNRGVRLSEAQPCVEISAADARTRLLVVRADEESTMVRDALTIVAQ
jgi:acetate kinase